MTAAAIKLNRGSSTDDVLENQMFLAHWRELYNQCPYATTFQAPAFVRTWYRVYRAEWEPVIVQSSNENGDFIGLWFLAYKAITRELVHAGAHQAEYHTWLAAPGCDVAFVAEAWTTLIRSFDFSKLRTKYLPSPVLLDSLQAAMGSNRKIIFNVKSRPLEALDKKTVQIAMSKQNYKRKFNGLKKLGSYEFRQIITNEDLDRVLDDLIAYYDFRQGAMNHSCPFKEDPNKRLLLSALFNEADAGVYMTVAYLDHHPIAAFWGLSSGQMVHLGMLIHSPFLAKYSIGKTHIVQLSERLVATGKCVLDLTPGGDPWKEDFANAHDQVVEAAIYCSCLRCFQAKMTRVLLCWARLWALRIGINPHALISNLRVAQRLHPGTLYRKCRYRVGAQRELRFYRVDRRQSGRYLPDDRVQCNALCDLLKFEQEASRQTRNRFLSSCYERIGQGETVYTICFSGRLAHCGWLMMGQARSFFPEIGRPVEFPPDTARLHDFHSHSKYNDEDLFRATLGHMLHAAFLNELIRSVYMEVLAESCASGHLIESMGFQYERSVYSGTMFSKKKEEEILTLSPLDVNKQG